MQKPFKNLQRLILKSLNNCNHEKVFQVLKERRDKGIDVYEKCSCGYFKKVKTVFGDL